MSKFKSEQAAAVALMEFADPRSDTFAIMSRNDPSNPFRIATDRVAAAGMHIVLSDWKDMPNVLDALGMLADGKIGLSGYGSDRDVLVLSPDVCTRKPLAQDALDYLTGKCGWEILLDEREDDAPVSIVPGTFSRNKAIGSHWYELDIAEISCSLPRGHMLDNEVAFLYLRNRFVFAVRGAFDHSFVSHPRQRGNKKKSYKMNAVSRCVQFANMVCAGHDDFSEFAKRVSNKKKWKADALRFVDVPNSALPGELADLSRRIKRFRDYAELWEAAGSNAGEEFLLTYRDLDDGSAAAKVATRGREIGMDAFFRAYGKNIPMRDIVAGF